MYERLETNVSIETCDEDDPREQRSIAGHFIATFAREELVPVHVAELLQDATELVGVEEFRALILYLEPTEIQ